MADLSQKAIAQVQNFVRTHLTLYPQPQGGRPSVQDIPLPDEKRPALPEPKVRPLPQAPQ